MKRYDITEGGGYEEFPDGIFYRVTDADARIEALEKALQSCLLVLVNQREAVSRWNNSLSNAISEANDALDGRTS